MLETRGHYFERPRDTYQKPQRNEKINLGFDKKLHAKKAQEMSGGEDFLLFFLCFLLLLNEKKSFFLGLFLCYDFLFELFRGSEVQTHVEV